MNATTLQMPSCWTCREALATFEAFRRLGFAADDIFFEPLLDPTTKQKVYAVALHTQGKVFSVAVGLLDDGLPDRMAAAAAWWNAQEPQNRFCERIWEGSHVRANAVDLLVVLHQRGFKIPANQVSAKIKGRGGDKAPREAEPSAKVGNLLHKKRDVK